jgi:PBP1b-binding outer membrane lipoprotein LpoB
MNKLLFLLVAILSSVLLTGCQQAPAPQPENEQATENPALPEPAEEELSFIGSWTRVGMVLNGTPMDQTPAVLTLNTDHTYTSIGSCAASGTYNLADEEQAITMVIASTNCYGSGPGLTAVYTFTISEDGNTMTNTTNAGGSILVETYIKNS